MVLHKDPWKLINGLLTLAVGLGVATAFVFLLLYKHVSDEVGSPSIPAFRKNLAGGIEFARQGLAPKAEQLFKQALALKPRSRIARLHLARLYEAQSRPDRAWREYQRVMPAEMKAGAKSTLDPETLATYGDLALRLGHRDLSIRAYRMAIERSTGSSSGQLRFVSPSLDRDHQFVIASSLASKLQENAKASLKKVARSANSPEPLGAAAHMVAGSACLANWDYPHAAGQFRLAAILAPKNWLALSQLASIELSQGKPEESKAHFAEATKAAGPADRSDIDLWTRFLEAKSKLPSRF